MTTDELDHAVARIAVAPTAANGLRTTSKIMVDKILAVPKAKISKVVGKLDPESLARLNSSLAALLDL
jgi:mRNA interferase MazF